LALVVMRLLAHPVPQVEATAVIVLLTASPAQAAALAMEWLAAPAVVVGGLALAEQEHQAKVLLAVLVLSVVILPLIPAEVAVVLAQRRGHQLMETQ
jgi:hypothetical protein